MDRLRSALIQDRLELGWLAFALANLLAMLLLISMGGPTDWETVPFHFVYVSFTILYGFRVWRSSRTVLGIRFVSVSTGGMTLSPSWPAARAGRRRPRCR